MTTASAESILFHPHSLCDPLDADRMAPRAEVPPAKATSFHEVLACIDGSELGSGVLPHAQLVAQALGARLTLLRVLERGADVGGPQGSLEWGILRREARAHLDRLAAELPKLEKGLRAELIQGRAAEQICRWAEQHAIDLTVLCSHGARGLTEWDLASTARKLIDRIPGSLLLVPAAIAMRTQVPSYRRILVPLDGSARAESVIPVALRVAAAQDAKVFLVHIVPIPEMTRIGPLDAEGVELERRVVEHNHRIATAYLDRIRSRLDQGSARIRTRVVRDGNIRARLERMIRDERIDLVVMSAHGYSGRTDWPCGSVTEHAVTHATTPVFVIRERSKHRARRDNPPGTPSLSRPEQSDPQMTQ